MFPKQIIIQSLSNDFLNILDSELSHIPSIRYNYYKINGIYFINIKCANYYKHFSYTESQSFYGSYLYLYTTISLLLSELIINYYESTLVKREIKNNYFYLEDSNQEQITNITLSILDPNFPSSICQELYIYRKKIILNELLKNFRKKNYINIDSFVNFGALNYILQIGSIVDKAVELYFTDIENIDILEYILQNWLKHF